MSLLRTQSSDQGPRSCRQPGARHPGGNGRGFRRQGRVSVDDCGARRAAGVEIGPAGQTWSTIAPRTWRRRPSAIPRAPATGRRSLATASCSPWRLTSSSTAARTPRSRPSSSRAARFTPPARTRARTSGSPAAPSRPTRRRTEPFAGSARRRVSLLSSGIWTAWRRRWVSRRRSFAGGISFRRVRLRRPDK
jgi:hypothetical protein